MRRHSVCAKGYLTTGPWLWYLSCAWYEKKPHGDSIEPKQLGVGTRTESLSKRLSNCPGTVSLKVRDTTVDLALIYAHSRVSEVFLVIVTQRPVFNNGRAGFTHTLRKDWSTCTDNLIKRTLISNRTQSKLTLIRLSFQSSAFVNFPRALLRTEFSARVGSALHSFLFEFRAETSAPVRQCGVTISRLSPDPPVF